MTKLTNDQRQFLQSIGVKLNETLDATGMKRDEYRKLMKESNLKIAYGVSPCKNSGHTMRTRSFHCIECNPLALVYSNRHSESGFIYVAYSNLRSLTKIGSCADTTGRAISLCKQNYGGASDWKIVYEKYLEKNIGDTEKKIQSSLKSHKASGTYFKDGKQQSASEIFSCSANTAIDAVNRIIHQTNIQ